MLLANNLCTYILQYHHNHILTEHFRQNKILELIHHSYTILIYECQKFLELLYYLHEIQTITLQVLWITQVTPNS